MTKDERKHYGRIADHGCIVCLLAGFEHTPCEIHHIRSGAGAGQKSHWSKAIGLCPAHHRLGGYGVAIHSGIEGFEDAIGMSEVELLAKQLDLLNGVTE
jgi:hypothetical protein